MINDLFFQSNSILEFSLFDQVEEHEEEEDIFPSLIHSGTQNKIDNFEITENSHQLYPYLEPKISLDAFNQINKNDNQNESEIESCGEEAESFLGHKRKSSNNESDKDISNKSSQKETKDFSDDKILQKIIKFKTSNENEHVPPPSNEKTEYRNDYFIKKFKKDCFSNYMTKKLNKYLKESQFPKRTKIYKPNCNAFTSIANLNKNLVFLSMKIKEVFALNDAKEGNLQDKNSELFNKIFTQKKLKNCEKLKELLNLSVEDAIKEYYLSEEFKIFCAKDEIKKYNNEFFKEKKFSMLKECGFLKLIKAQY